jgi:hypothetical protein
MSTDPNLMPERTPVVNNSPTRRYSSRDPSVDRDQKATKDIFDEPLNAEEATILVIDFLIRLSKRIVTPRKAVLEGDKFIVDVELKDATASVHININTREIVEYTIIEKTREPRPLPISAKKISMILAVVTAIIVFFVMFTVFRDNMTYIISNLQNIKTDYFLIAAAIVGVAGGVLWWRRRS